MHDICENKHGGNARSVEARPAKHSAEAQRAWILEQVRRMGPFGRTCDELSEVASRINGRDVPPNRISGRISELKAAGLLVVSQTQQPRRTRAGKSADVLVLPEFARPRPREADYRAPGFGERGAGTGSETTAGECRRTDTQGMLF